MIAVTFALPAESSDFLHLMEARTGGPIVSGRLHEQELCVLHTGVGRRSAREKIRRFLLERRRPQLLITAGFAGGLADKLQVADLLLAENFSDPGIFAIAREALASSALHLGKLATAGTVLDSAEERREFGERRDALAVDMETEFIVAECRAAGVPTLSLRAITDTAAFPFPIPPRILFDLARQRTNVARLTLHLTTHPRAIGKLIAFAGRVARARKALTAALDLLLRRGLA